MPCINVDYSTQVQGYLYIQDYLEYYTGEELRCQNSTIESVSIEIDLYQIGKGKDKNVA